ncbi:MarR family transcriptional regulator [Parafrigoribacterium mesophilum]|uniref:MarR family winged helix-turn-helix transcriptional regulator n=1 Tax=Parafrigoribacterium mesophilum TaxID=433646 RepID=UPI0031FC4507
MAQERALAVKAWESLFRAQVTVMRRLAAEFPKGEVSLAEYDVLFTLSTQPGRRLRARDLGKHVLLTQPSVSRMTDRLVRRKLVSKCPDPGDGRGIIVQLSDEGFEVFRRAAATHMASIREAVGGALTAEELVQLTELTDKLRRYQVDR